MQSTNYVVVFVRCTLDGLIVFFFFFFFFNARSLLHGLSFVFWLFVKHKSVQGEGWTLIC